MKTGAAPPIGDRADTETGSYHRNASVGQPAGPERRPEPGPGYARFMARVILDGYNLLLTSGAGADERARESLVREAARYRGERGIEVLVVFDSRVGGGTRSATAYPGVQVEFARGEADAAILDIVRRSRSPRDLLVVTSDRRLADAARDLGARSEDVASFRARAATRKRSRAGPVTSPGPSAKEVAEWLSTFSKPRDEEF